MGTLLDLLQAASGEESLRGRIGRWRQEVSQAIDGFQQIVTIIQGGGSPLAELDMLETRRSGLDQLGLGVGSDVVLNNLLFERGAATYDFNTGIYTLVPGKFYELDAGGPIGGFSDATAGFLEISWVDAVTNVPVSADVPGLYKPSTQTNASSNGGRSRALFIATSAADARVKLRVMAATGTGDIPQPYFSAIVKQLR